MMEREVTGQRAKVARSRKPAQARRGLAIERYFSTKGVDPADEVAWESRTASITGEGGAVIFEQKDVEVPKTWSLLATNVVETTRSGTSGATSARMARSAIAVWRPPKTLRPWSHVSGTWANQVDPSRFMDPRISENSMARTKYASAPPAARCTAVSSATGIPAHGRPRLLQRALPRAHARGPVRCQIAAGQRSSAIETYMQCRDKICEELGLDPSAEMRALYGEILAMEDGVDSVAFDPLAD